MLKLRQLSILIAVIIIANGVHAASMTVSTVQEFHAALKVAETNLQSDTILLAPGVYQVDDLAGQLLTYLPNGTDPGAENYELTISATNGVAIIDGNASKQGMRLDAFGTDMENAHITVQGLKFRECRISSTFFTGAGLYVRTQNANILIENCLFTYCIASAFFEDPNGGGCFAKAGGAGTAVVRNCRFWDNRADIFGGGLYMVGGANVRVENCTFLRNEGWRGGAFYINANAQTYVYNCTFYNNIGNSTEAGGGMYLCMYNDNYTAILFNNIVWSNTAPLGTGADIYLEDDPNGNGTGAVVNVAYCDFSDLGATIGDNVTLNNNINLDPMLVSTNDTNCLLQITSPCIDAGTNIAGMVCDANGIPRPLDGDTNDTAVVDMGAYEFVHPFADTDHDCMLDRVEIEYQMDPTVSNEFVNFPPVFSAIEDKNVFYGNELQFSVVANDPNQNIPVLSAPVKPADAVFVDNGDGTGVFTWTPDQPGDIGTNTVRFIASDGAQETTNDVTIRVYSININSPLSGTMARIRKYLSISWSGAWALGAVDISLWRNGSIVLSITNNLSAPTSNMVWQTLLPACLTPATNYVLRVTDSDATNDYAVSACFSIFKYCFQDFDGDGVDDYGCYDAAGNYGQSPGSWYLMKSDEGFDGSVVFGYAGTVPVIGDFDGDGRADYGCYDAAGNCGQPPGSWYIMMSTAGFDTRSFGYFGTVPVTGDFDGDGVDDYGCYDAAGNYGQSPGSWYIMMSTAGFDTRSFGYSGTVPVTGDFDGDGVDDYGCYDAVGNCGQPPGSWYIMMSTAGFDTRSFGYSGTVPISGDFDGDGVDDYGCYDAAGNYGQSPGSWYLMKSDEGFDGSVVFGYAGTVPVIGDFDGDGRADYGCYDAAGNCGQPPGSWYIMMSKDGFTTITFGYASTTPLARLVQ